MLRIAFLGQATYFRQVVPPQPTAQLYPQFFDARDGIDPSAAVDSLITFMPDVAVVFRPDSFPREALDRIPCPLLGVVTEPLPRVGRTSDPILDHNLVQLARIAPDVLDRAIVCDSLGFASATRYTPSWRAMPLPVADDLYRPPRASAHPPRIVTIGPSTAWRERALISLKHNFDVVHYAHGLTGSDLADALHEADIGLAVRGSQYVVTFQHEVLLFLAAGLLPIATGMDPTYGLERDLDYLECHDEYQLDLRVHQVSQRPDAFDRIRHRGHRAAQQYRASTVWDRVARDALHDLAVFGTTRCRRVS